MQNTITLGHGGGGRLMAKLIDNITEKLNFSHLTSKLDSALLELTDTKTKLAFTTDSFVVKPLFFPGGDIGKLSICGTVNDLSVVGAVPKYISLSFIIEDGFSEDNLTKIIESISKTAKEAGVEIVTGDTKVVENGHGDGIYINTAGIGILSPEIKIHPDKIQQDDLLLINGTLGDHAMTIMSLRENLGFKTDLKSDCAPLNNLVHSMLTEGINIKFMRDITRGGLAAVLNELTSITDYSFEIDEESIKIHPDVTSLSDILGIDPLHMANEGKILFIVAKKDADRALSIMLKTKYGQNSYTAGRVLKPESNNKRALLKTVYGSSRIISYPMTEKLPRIC